MVQKYLACGLQKIHKINYMGLCLTDESPSRRSAHINDVWKFDIIRSDIIQFTFKTDL